MTTLFDILDSSESSQSLEISEEKEKILNSRPFSRDLLKNTLVLEKLSIPEIEKAIETGTYLLLEQEKIEKLFEEFLWKVGEFKGLFHMHFEHEDEKEDEDK